jgi:hypothetical protein
MTNAKSTVCVGEPFGGGPTTARGAYVDLCGASNPSNTPITATLLVLVSAGIVDARTLAFPDEIEVPARSSESIGLAIVGAPGMTLELGPQQIIGPTESLPGHLRCTIANTGEVTGTVDAYVVRSGPSERGPSDAPSPTTLAAQIEVSSGSYFELGVVLGIIADVDQDELDHLAEQAGRPRALEWWASWAPAGDPASGPEYAWREIGDEGADAESDRCLEISDAALPSATYSVSAFDEHAAGADSQVAPLAKEGESATGGGREPDGDKSDGDFVSPYTDEADDSEEGGDGDGDEPDDLTREQEMPWMKGRLGVNVEVGLTLTDPEPAADLIALPGAPERGRWQVSDPGSIVSLESLPADHVMKVRVPVLTTRKLEAAYEAPALVSGGGALLGDSVPRSGDQPPSAAAARSRVRQSSIPGVAADPVTATSATRGRPVLPIAIAIAVITLVLAGAFVVFSGDGGDQTPASSEDATGAQAGAAAVATVATGGGAASETPSATTPGVIAGRPVNEQLELIAKMFESGAGAALRRGELSIGADGRRVAGAAPITWDARTEAFVGADEESGDLYVLFRGPSSVAGNSCGEADLIVGGQHVGGVDFCSEGATAPGHLSNIVRFALNEDGDWFAVLLPTGLSAPESGEVAIWLYRTEENGAYDAVERFVLTADIPRLRIAAALDAAADVLVASIDEPPPPQLAVPSIGGSLGTSTAATPSPEATAFSGVIAPGFYAVVFSGERVGTCGFQATYTSNISLEVGISPAGDEFHELTFFDGQTRATGVIKVQTGEFSDVGGQYSGSLTDDFQTPQQITRTLQTAACLATYTITVTAQ